MCLIKMVDAGEQNRMKEETQTQIFYIGVIMAIVGFLMSLWTIPIENSLPFSIGILPIIFLVGGITIAIITKILDDSTLNPTQEMKKE